MEGKVEILSSTLVGPKQPTNSQPFQLTIFDRWNFHCPFQKRVIFYGAPQPPDVAALLERSLAQVLLHFFPLAGRLQPFDGRPSHLLCSDEGVFFSQAVTDARIDDLLPFNPSSFTHTLIQTGNIGSTCPWPADSPLLFIQVTRFSCGGISLGFAYSHQMVDGPSIWHFIKSWSETARSKPLSLNPLISYNYSLPQSCFNTPEDLSMESAESAASLPSQQNHSEQASTTAVGCFYFGKAKIESLKSSVNNSSFTSFEIISSHIWHKISQARCLSPTESTLIIILMNCRKRLPSLPAEYFGNAIGFNFATAAVSELSSKGLDFAAETVHKAIKDATPDKLQRDIYAMDGIMEGRIPLPSIMSKPKVLIAGSHRHPLYEVDFGFGKPLGASYGMDDWSDGKVYLLPGSRGEGIHATICLSSQALQRLKQDPDFC